MAFVTIPSSNYSIIDTSSPTSSRLAQGGSTSFLTTSLVPKVISVNRTTNSDGIDDVFLKLEVFANIDVVNYFKSKQDVNQTVLGNSSFLAQFDQSPAKIEVRLSKNHIGYYQAKARNTALSNQVKIKRDKESNLLIKERPNSGISPPVPSSPSPSPSQLLNATNAVPVYALEKKQSLYNDALKVGTISLGQIGDSIFKEKLQIERLNTVPALKSQAEIDTFIDMNLSNVFTQVYQSMIEKNQDPAALFQDGFKKISYKEIKKGICKQSKRNINLENVLSIYDGIKSSITSLSMNNYNITKTLVQENITKKGVVFNINFSKLQEFGESFYVLLIAKNARGVNLEAKSYKVELEDIRNQMEKNGIEYNITPKRLNSGVSMLSVTSKNKHRNLELDVVARRVKANTPFEMCYYEDLTKVFALPGETINIKDGVPDKKTNSPSRFRVGESIHYRTLLNFQNKKYFNAKSAIDKSRQKNTTTPHVTIHGELLFEGANGGAGIGLTVENISSNIVKIRPRKYMFKGNTPALSEMKYLMDSDGEQKSFVDVRGLSTYRFVDFDVYRTTNYKYVVECIMKNGEKKIASACFIEQYEERTGSVLISNIVAGSESAADVYEEDVIDSVTRLSNKRQVNLRFTVQKIENEIDKILANMFGDLFELFKSDLQEIRDVQSVVYSIKIDRYNHLTGEYATVGKVTPDENGRCLFLDDTAPLYSKITYKLTPRITPTLDLINFVNDQVSLFAQRSIHQTGMFSRASGQRRAALSRERIVSKPGNKYANRNTFLKGLITTPQFRLSQENLDFFLNSSTGDIEYTTVTGPNLFSPPANLSIESAAVFEIISPLDDIQKQKTHARVTKEMRKVSASELASFKKTSSLDNQGVLPWQEIKNLDTRYFNISFEITGNDMMVDFYAIFVKENDNVYLDGIMHSTDEFKLNKSYNYLMKHIGGFGIVEYYLVPFHKGGSIDTPSIITAHEIK